MSTGLILSAPASGSGKTVLTLAILRALTAGGVTVSGAKSGPDYIDPAFHQAACGKPSLNLDAWAMPSDAIRALASRAEGLLLIEGAMGLFDGAPPAGRGATADLARLLDLPVILVIDAARQSHSVAALAEGFARHRAGVRIGGLILNRVGSARHEAMLRAALKDFTVIGALPDSADLSLPSRHLGLVQAVEHSELAGLLDRAARLAADQLDLGALTAMASPLPERQDMPLLLPPPGRTIALASDIAFSFAYPHVLQGWLAAGSRILPFSPFLGQGPDPAADAVYLPGGYPELHAARLAAASGFRSAMLNAAARGAAIWGECGGYMVLGRSLTDASGQSHPMLGLLDLDTSMAAPRRHLGYRQATAAKGPFPGDWAAHEFHYARTLHAGGQALFEASDAEGNPLGPAGLVRDNVAGSFLHLIANAAPA